MPTESVPYVPVARPIAARTSAEALYRAISAARYAPSAYNAQPWRWRLSDTGLDLFLEPDRMAHPGDPDGRRQLRRLASPDVSANRTDRQRR